MHTHTHATHLPIPTTPPSQDYFTYSSSPPLSHRSPLPQHPCLYNPAHKSQIQYLVVRVRVLSLARPPAPAPGHRHRQMHLRPEPLLPLAFPCSSLVPVLCLSLWFGRKRGVAYRVFGSFPTGCVTCAHPSTIASTRRCLGWMLSITTGVIMMLRR